MQDLLFSILIVSFWTEIGQVRRKNWRRCLFSSNHLESAAVEPTTYKKGQENSQKMTIFFGASKKRRLDFIQAALNVFTTE